MSNSYLIIGGSSDIAIQTIHKLLVDGNHVTILARDMSRVSQLAEQGVTVIEGDALDQDALNSAIQAATDSGAGKISE